MMNEQADADLHRLVWDELPWLINGTATAQQRERSLRHLDLCEACREEHQRQRQLFEHLQAAISSSDAGQAPSVEHGLANLLAHLPPQRGNSEEPEQTVADVRPVPARRMSWLGAVALAQAAAIGVMAIGLVLHEREPADYRSLTAPDAPIEVVGPRWRVLPDEDMKLGEWRALLEAHGLQVLSGPNSAGAWELASRSTSADHAQLQQRLRLHARLRLVEPISQP